jgi:putative ABC transport system permease protein
MGWSRYFRRGHWDDERARELEAYLATETDENIARGMTPEAARQAAHRKLGNPTLIREEIYQMNSIRFVEALCLDLRYATRLLRRNPTFAVVAILTLALGTGANTAIFQLVDAVRLRALPVEAPEQLLEIRVDAHDKGRTGSFLSRRPNLSEPLFRRIEAEQQVFSGLAAWGAVKFDLADGGESRPAQGLYVNGSFFETLGVHAQLGRVLTAIDDVKGCAAPSIVLSEAFWRREFAGSPEVIGRTLKLDGHAYQIVGVSASGFFGVDVGRSFDVAAPICAEPLSRGTRSGIGKADVWFLAAFGRLKPGLTAAMADAQLGAISLGIFEEIVPPNYTAEDARSYRAFTLTSTPASTGVSSLRGAYATPLWILLGVTGLVLLITCANLANLMLARTTAREREIAVRLAIGASRRRIVRQMLSESLLIAVTGTAGGLVLAAWASRTLVAYLSTQGNAFFVDLSFDWRIFGFAAGLAVAACLLFGLAPAVRATATSLVATMKTAGRGTTSSRERFTARRVLVVVQVALSLVLIVGALLFARSLRNLVTLDPGFREDGLLIVNMDLRRANVPPDVRPALYERIVDRLRQLPGVDSAAQAFILPVTGSTWNNRVVIGGAVQQTMVNFNSVGPEYFRTMGTPLVAGRAFTAADTVSSPKTAVVNQLFARTFFQSAQAVGRSFQIETGPGEAAVHYQIVGVVKDSKYADLREPLAPLAYLAASQDAEAGPFLQAVVHSSVALSAVSADVTQAVRDVNPSILLQFVTMKQAVRDSLVSERLMASLSGFFGLLAALIATIGLYGVMSYVVARRQMEIGIRMALGADRGMVVRLIVREAGVLLAAGLAIGAGLSIAAGRTATSLLYGLQPWDAASLTAGLAGLATVALLASWLPARRASRLDPTIALREE